VRDTVTISTGRSSSAPTSAWITSSLLCSSAWKKVSGSNSFGIRVPLPTTPWRRRHGSSPCLPTMRRPCQRTWSLPSFALAHSRSAPQPPSTFMTAFAAEVATAKPAAWSWAGGAAPGRAASAAPTRRVFCTLAVKVQLGSESILRSTFCSSACLAVRFALGPAPGPGRARSGLQPQSRWRRDGA
jgi:hypothetical protein